MTQVDLYDSHYSNIEAETYRQIRKETYDKDLGQTSWITADECDKFCNWLNLQSSEDVLEIASGTGGIAAYVARKYNVKVCGLDINQDGIEAARARAHREKMTFALRFQVANANEPLPFPDESFDVVFCNDAIGHLTNRIKILMDWHRVLKPTGRIIYTDPILVTGPLTVEEIMIRSSIGHHLFTPLGTNEQLLREAGFGTVQVENVTTNVVLTSGRWHAARTKHRATLLQFEKQEQYDGVQQFLFTTHQLADEGRLSRYAFMAVKSNSDSLS